MRKIVFYFVSLEFNLGDEFTRECINNIPSRENVEVKSLYFMTRLFLVVIVSTWKYYLDDKLRVPYLPTQST